MMLFPEPATMIGARQKWVRRHKRERQSRMDDGHPGKLGLPPRVSMMVGSVPEGQKGTLVV
jgi:hypothetical protein